MLQYLFLEIHVLVIAKLAKKATMSTPAKKDYTGKGIQMHFFVLKTNLDKKARKYRNDEWQARYPRPKFQKSDLSL